MGEGKRQMFQGPYSQKPSSVKEENKCVVMDGDYYNTNNITLSSSSTSSIEDSAVSNESSSSSLDITDDASSSISYSSSEPSTGSLYDLSDIMAQLPIKRGLSKYYQGKSESFTSLSRVSSIEDLAKKESPYRRKMKGCKSYEGGLDTYKSYTLPKPTISKKTSNKGGLFSSFSFPGRRGSFASSCRPPLIPVQENLGC